jgi:lipopolysaccharide/colanic/teichoic acid biosynthesis glycosyltransferase
VVKRLLDVVIAFSGLVLLAPVFIVITLAVWLSMGPPVFYRDVRPGRGSVPFTLLKFRTMREADAGRPQSDSERITRLGRFLRRTSLDELPELWNVLVGDMSLVGPRPLLMEYLPLYSPEQARRHEVRPGITGWAQVNGRNATSWEQRFACDVWYVENRTLLLDIRILGVTLLKVVRTEGISHFGHATMPKFRGSRSQ